MYHVPKQTPTRAIGASVGGSPRTPTWSTILGRASISSPGWSASPKRSPRSPYRERSLGVDAKVEVSELNDDSRRSPCLMLRGVFKIFVSKLDNKRSILCRKPNPRAHPPSSEETCTSQECLVQHSLECLCHSDDSDARRKKKLLRTLAYPTRPAELSP